MVNKRILSVFLLHFLANTTFGQSSDADFMSSIGKIYVVVAVIVAVFIGIVIFLIYLDRKLTKLEDQIKEHD
jgi:CcmD family protein